MSEIPGFIAIETGDEEGLPVAIAWSLSDGRIKHTLIHPDDSWFDDSSSVTREYSSEELESLAVSPLDVIRELENDHFSATLYTNDSGEDELALTRIFDTYGMDPFIELAPAETLYDNVSASEWQRQRSDAFGELSLEPMRPEHEVEVMLSMHQRLSTDEA
ncbi:hypothetical protein [Halomonas llamarensis]|uniref:Uncharacterized protein n=1 Tax=Halomonas llamarensis TaxID=2945104 RepID=A0ABT0SRU7_9GAMM|nr:hypothetical protein [Halomonas llamarensis]MCL7930552.1 hypothetical protein [Halomonas llamarensis]